MRILEARISMRVNPDFRLRVGFLIALPPQTSRLDYNMTSMQARRLLNRILQWLQHNWETNNGSSEDKTAFPKVNHCALRSTARRIAIIYRYYPPAGNMMSFNGV